jgi:CheY-like chemotaxis protein
MPKKDVTIMVVEDEVLLLQAITKKLKLSGIDVISCSSGRQAIDYLQSLDELPDGIWTDYYLQDINGLAFMQTLKDNPLWANIPVVVVSNSASPEKVHNMLALGAKKYILKAEYRLDEIITMMLELISDTTPEDPEDSTQPQPPATPPSTSGTSEVPPQGAPPSGQ